MEKIMGYICFGIGVLSIIASIIFLCFCIFEFAAVIIICAIFFIIMGIIFYYCHKETEEFEKLFEKNKQIKSKKHVCKIW